MCQSSKKIWEIIHREDAVLTLLIHLGYLSYDALQQAVCIPNEEVRQEFLRAVKAGRHKEIAKMNAMDKKQIYHYLREKGIWYKAIEHEAVYTVEQAKSLNLPDPEAGAKNLFLRDDKKRNYYLLSIRDTLSVSLKEFQRKIGTRRLSFASEEDLFCMMKLAKGAVTPFGVMNDDRCMIKVYIDAFFEGKIISVHPNDNTATVYLECNDLVKLIREHGNFVEYFLF